MRIKKDEQTREEKWGAVEEEVGKEGSRRRRRRSGEGGGRLSRFLGTELKNVTLFRDLVTFSPPC